MDNSPILPVFHLCQSQLQCAQHVLMHNSLLQLLLFNVNFVCVHDVYNNSSVCVCVIIDVSFDRDDTWKVI